MLRALLSNPRADIQRLARLATQFLRDSRKSPHFLEHRRDLAEALYQVARRALEEAKANLDRLLLEQVQEIYAALQEIGFGLGDPAVRSNELAQGIQQADYALRLAEARNRVQLAMQAAFHLQRPTLVAQAQELFARLSREFPELAKEQPIFKPLAQLGELESSWLGCHSWLQWQVALAWATASHGTPAFPLPGILESVAPWVPEAVWQLETAMAGSTSATTPTSNATPHAMPVVLSEGGRLLALDGASGRTLWTASLTGEKTLRVVYRHTTEPRLYVWASERRLLAAIDTANARLLWTRRMPGYAPFVPSVCPPDWWLVEPTGWVWHGETETGRIVGAFWLDYPLTAGIGVNPVNRCACVATAQNRSFLLDPRNRRASVMLSGHEAGSLAGEPLVFPAGVVLILRKGEQMQLLGVRFADKASPGGLAPSAPSAAAPSSSLLRWPGRQLLATFATGEAAVLVTDRSEAILLQAASQHPARVLGGSKWTFTLPALGGSTHAPAIRILGERLGDWWLVTSGAVLRLHWDDYREQLRQESYPLPAGQILDASWDPQQPGRFVLLLREPGGQLRAVAWDLRQTNVVWNRAMSSSKPSVAKPAANAP
uniref:WD-40 repeat-containing protein n=1 Tax=uncultured Planctomycetota bacterium TaxID=120965 RepID=H5SJQ5_9BACT|nr:WD-40 repeat-containing protein [uncultured Planctomycetota bacterium]